MSKDDTLELVKRVARKRLSKSDKFDRFIRATEEIVPDETSDERKKRLTDMHWELFGEAPPFNPKAERPGQQPELPLEGE